MQISNRDQQRLKRDAHRNLITEKAKKYPDVFAKGLLLNSELMVGIQDIEEVFSILLNNGQKDTTEGLLRHPKTLKQAISVLASVLLLG